VALVPHVLRYLRGRRAEPTDLERKQLRRLSLKDLHYLDVIVRSEVADRFLPPPCASCTRSRLRSRSAAGRGTRVAPVKHL
jgi:hypothetical protein